MDKALKTKVVRFVWRVIPDRLLEDSKGYPTELCWRIHGILVKLHLAAEVKIVKGPFKLMWGDKEITNIRNLDIK